jgi:putative DNA primase/helicase
MKPMVYFALDWARRGIPVHPCKPWNKHPYLQRDKDAAGEAIDGTGGVHRASTDPALISQWWDQWPNAMVGIALGKVAGVWAVDPDIPKKPGDPDGVAYWAELQAKHGKYPFTHTHVSPSGGRHLLGQAPGQGHQRAR